MRGLIKRLYRERRRLFVVAVLTFLGGFIAFFKRSDALFGVPFPVISGFAFMVGLTLPLMALVVFFPKIRHCAESVAASIPVLSFMGAFSNASDGGVSTQTSIFGILLCYLTVTVYGGNWLDRYLPRRLKQLHSRSRSKLSPDKLWPYLTVTPDTPKEYWDDDLISLDWIEPGKSFRETNRMGDLGKIEELHHIEVFKPYDTYRFRFEVPDATENAPISRGSYEIRLTSSGTGTALVTLREFDRVTLRAELFNWIDDAMGRIDDRYVQGAERAVGGAQVV